VWVAKWFICYLYDKLFTFRTDHAALTYLNSFSDTNTKRMRWSLKLPELDFTFRHRAGTKIPHVDALSRHVSNVLNESKLSYEEMRGEQEKDQFCKQLKPGSYSSGKEFYDDMGLIYRRQKYDKHQLLVPRTLIKDVIRENHDPFTQPTPD